MSAPTALVTGGASGIGLAAAIRLLGKGYRLAVLDLDTDRVRKSLAGHEDKVVPIGADIADPQACGNAVGEALAELGRLDAFLHFAAAWAGTPWRESQPDEWDRLLAVNVKGAFFLAQAVAEPMARQKSGNMVLTASDSAKVGGVAGGPAYVATKGAVIGLTHSLAKALGPLGIRVNAVNPGVVQTAMTASWPDAVKQAAVSATPLGRLAEPDDIAAAACFLVSDESRFITGEIVEVNGGFYFD